MRVNHVTGSEHMSLHPEYAMDGIRHTSILCCLEQCIAFEGNIRQVHTFKSSRHLTRAVRILQFKAGLPAVVRSGANLGVTPKT